MRGIVHDRHPANTIIQIYLGAGRAIGRRRQGSCGVILRQQINLAFAMQFGPDAGTDSNRAPGALAGRRITLLDGRKMPAEGTLGSHSKNTWRGGKREAFMMPLFPSVKNPPGRLLTARRKVESANAAFVEEARRVFIELLISRGHANIDDLRSRITIPPDVNLKSLGTVPLPFVKKRMIEAVGGVKSGRPVAHRRQIRMWVLIDRQAAEDWLRRHRAIAYPQETPAQSIHSPFDVFTV